MIPAMGIQESGEQMETNPAALDTGGGAACYNRGTSSVNRFQAQPKWEMSVYKKVVLLGG